MNPVTQLHLRDLPQIRVAGGYQIDSPGIYRIGSLQAAYYPKNFAERLYVFFSGYVDRKRLALPVFRRWQWQAQVPGHALYLSDPTLEACEDLGIGWFIGDSRKDCMDAISTIVMDLAGRLRIGARGITFYGSSGGGFAALRALRWLPEAAAIAVNPQTRLTAFRPHSLPRYLTRFYDGMTPEEFAQTFPMRNALLTALQDCRDSSVVYAQNTKDDHHFSGHFQELHSLQDGVWQPTHFARETLVLFEDDHGHDTAESRDMMPGLTRAAETLQQQRFGGSGLHRGLSGAMSGA